MFARIRSRLAFIAMACLAGSAPMSAGSALAAEGIVLRPHRAVYDFTMGTSAGQKGPSSASGRIVYEILGDACTGYSVNFRQSTEVTPVEGEVRSADVSSATFEDADSKTFRFRYDTYSEGRVVRTVEGSAERSVGGLSIALTRPVQEKIDLGVEPTFPVQQSLKTIAAARAGRNVLELKTYDGTDNGKKLFHTLQIIGAPLKKPAGDLADGREEMRGLQRWRVVASNFDLNKIDDPAIYTLKFELWENGVSSNVTIDYGNFTLVGKMTRLELFPVKPCKK